MKVDLSGQKYGRLTVLDVAGKTKWGATIWRCLCDCGKETATKASNILSGHSRSCGCQKGFATSTFSPRAAAKMRRGAADE